MGSVFCPHSFVNSNSVFASSFNHTTKSCIKAEYAPAFIGKKTSRKCQAYIYFPKGALLNWLSSPLNFDCRTQKCNKILLQCLFIVSVNCTLGPALCNGSHIEFSFTLFADRKSSTCWFVRVCVWERESERARACMCMCAHVCMHAYVHLTYLFICFSWGKFFWWFYFCIIRAEKSPWKQEGGSSASLMRRTNRKRLRPAEDVGSCSIPESICWRFISSPDLIHSRSINCIWTKRKHACFPDMDFHLAKTRTQPCGMDCSSPINHAFARKNLSATCCS